MKNKTVIAFVLASAALLLAGCNVGTVIDPTTDGSINVPDSGDLHVCGSKGFCQSIVMSSCGSPLYDPEINMHCQLGDGGMGFCCIPWEHDGGSPDAQVPCNNPCDCITGQFCMGGLCKPPDGTVGAVYCCDRPCPASAPCQHASGSYGTCKTSSDAGM
jgi:hypothetical protein